MLEKPCMISFLALYEVQFGIMDHFAAVKETVLQGSPVSRDEGELESQCRYHWIGHAQVANSSVHIILDRLVFRRAPTLTFQRAEL
jgi:hypothetical protein